MQRKLKFRVWDKKHNHFVIDDFVISSSGSLYCLLKYGEYARIPNEDENYIVQQFTGFKDKNGKEIYEGDILSFLTKREYGHQEDGVTIITKPVEFGRFYVNDNLLYSFIGFHIDGKSIDYILSYNAVVIGNIFENPELLK